ncbi:hypothetical protein BGW38_001111 [Lunasporangiospora selenospora]|uniref:Uncharacterized protein n=1 Tax=Lunasporangiospora selenospora TaxID=979761 RepID=A0A9P6KEH0_9FUNG|nr:hypothetical protein BGW38_001111 [Lunasporangiospora selenospora]
MSHPLAGEAPPSPAPPSHTTLDTLGAVTATTTDSAGAATGTSNSYLLPESQSHHQSNAIPPSEFVFQLILEQFWGDGVSKREIRSVFSTSHDANTACQDYLLRTWPREKFTSFEVGHSPQQLPEQRPGDQQLIKIAALIHGDRFNVWVERHPWEGTLDFSSKAIARRAGKGPNAYILQRTIKDASGGKRRSTTRGIYATRDLAKQALTQDAPPSEWSSNQGYVLEPGGEYAHAQSPSGKTAWLFIEVRPLFMSYSPLEQDEQQQQQQQELELPVSQTLKARIVSTIGTSPSNPISLDTGDEPRAQTPSTPTLNIPSAASQYLTRSTVDSPMTFNPDEAGAFVYLVLQLKTLPYTPPILTVEAVTYEVDVANRFGIDLLEAFGGPECVFEPNFREDGCLQAGVEQQGREEGLSVWVEKRAVVLGDEAMDLDLISEHESIQSGKPQSSPLYLDADRDPTSSIVTATVSPSGTVEPEDGFESAGRKALTLGKAARTASLLSDKEDGDFTKRDQLVINEDLQYKVVIVKQAQDTSASSIAGSESGTEPRNIVDSSDDLSVAVVSTRMRFYHALTRLDITTVSIEDNLDKVENGSSRHILARSRSSPDLVLLELGIDSAV